MSQDLKEVRNSILEMYRRVQEENYYELLGVDPEADPTMVSSRFRSLAKQWHVDRFSQYDLGAEREKIQQIFSALNTAHQTLTDPERRAEYDMAIDDGPALGQILEAENLFRTAKNMMRTGAYKGAAEKIRRAYEINPELEYRAYMLYTEYLLIPKDESGAVRSRTRATEIFNELDELSETLSEKDWMMTFMGTVALGIGREAQAEELFREALQINPQNTQAQRQIRLLRMRRDRKSNKGFLAKLMGKFKG